jgi:predicted Zn-dependent protease with MMP-like domain
MWQVNDQQFEDLMNEGLAELLKVHVKSLKNVALIVEDFPSDAQRVKLKLSGYQTLLGLYEGVPLSQRQGSQKILPDKITLFKKPLEARADSAADLKEQIKHTLWHEIAHYYGLDHKAISALE